MPWWNKNEEKYKKENESLNKEKDSRKTMKWRRKENLEDLTNNGEMKPGLITGFGIGGILPKTKKENFEKILRMW